MWERGDPNGPMLKGMIYGAASHTAIKEFI
jgi:hypothetical protein